MFHCSVINVPAGFALASAATLIGYQTRKPLSTTFFVNLIFFYQSFFALCAFHAQGVYYHFLFIIATGFFSIFCTNFCTISRHALFTEKATLRPYLISVASSSQLSHDSHKHCNVWSGTSKFAGHGYYHSFRTSMYCGGTLSASQVISLPI